MTDVLNLGDQKKKEIAIKDFISKCFLILCLIWLNNTHANSNQNERLCTNSFPEFLDKMKLRALNEGILRETVTKVIFSTSYSDEVISLDRNQKVFRKSFRDT